MVGLNNLIISAALVALLLTDEGLLVTGPLPGLAVWLLASLLGCVAAFVPRFGFLGDPGSYLEFAFLPATLLVGHGWVVLGDWYGSFVGVTVVLGVALILGYRAGVDIPSSPEGEEAWAALTERLCSLDRNGVIFYPPDHSRQLAWETDHMVVDFLHNEEASIDQIRLLFPDSYLSFVDDPKLIRYYFNPPFAVFDRNSDDHDRLVPASASPLYRNDRYAVYDVDDIVRDRWKACE
jgi:hypothetical protein